jgi:HD-like signal output (HDOD) protein
MIRKRILFVDDEAHILDGLRDLLRKQRHQWDMTFTLGGEQALAELQKAPCDVIVSDMRMPGMDGAMLLQEVKQRYPRVARIVLSGHAEREAVVRALPVAHQYLSKPCDASLLRAVIERTCSLQALLQEERMRETIGSLESLPSVPRAYQELTRLAALEDVGLAQVARVIEEDPAMSAKVLQLVNSAYFGLARRIASVQQAVAHLGVELVRNLALTAHVFSAADAVRIPGLSLDELQHRSLLTARLAKRLVQAPTLADEAFATGMVCDIGKLILALSAPEKFAEVVRVSRTSGRPFHETELELLDVTHAHAGAYLLGVWGLPFTMVEAVAHHHTPNLVTAGDREILTAVHVADALLDGAGREGVAGNNTGGLNMEYLESVGRVQDFPRWCALAQEWQTAAEGR